MRVVARFSFKDGEQVVSGKYKDLYGEVRTIIGRVDAAKHRSKESKERTMLGRFLYSPASLNKEFKEQFARFADWNRVRVPCNYSTDHYVEDYTPPSPNTGAFREMDFVKRKLGIEVQFGKYAFMVYNVCAKMTIFKNLGHIDCGIEIVPVKALAQHMSTGVAYFEQFVWDLTHRGEADIDIPVLILGIDA